jgi:hypothetical protein
MVTAEFFSPFRSGSGFALSPPADRRSRRRNKSFICSLLSIVARFWLVRVVIPKMDRRRNSRRIQRGIAEYLASKSGGKRITKTASVES